MIKLDDGYKITVIDNKNYAIVKITPKSEKTLFYSESLLSILSKSSEMSIIGKEQSLLIEKRHKETISTIEIFLRSKITSTKSGGLQLEHNRSNIWYSRNEDNLTSSYYEYLIKQTALKHQCSFDEVIRIIKAMVHSYDKDICN